MPTSKVYELLNTVQGYRVWAKSSPAVGITSQCQEAARRHAQGPTKFCGRSPTQHRPRTELFYDTPTVKHQTVECVVGNMASSETASTFQANGVEDIPAADGMNGTAQRPKTPSNPTQSDGPLARTPSLSSFSLTEYSAKPTTPPRDKTHMKKIVPDEFLLPNGNPDVSHLASPSSVHTHATCRVHQRCVPTRISDVRDYPPVWELAMGDCGWPALCDSIRRVTEPGHSTCDSSSPHTLGSGRCATKFRWSTPST